MHLDNTSSLEAEVIPYTQLLLLRHEHHYLPKEAVPEKKELSLSGCPSVPLSIFGAFNEWVLRLVCLTKWKKRSSQIQSSPA